MTRPAAFSDHAMERVASRTRMTPHEVAQRLWCGAHVNMGAKPGIPKEYLLIYSPLDDAFFVAVRCTVAGTVVTFWPLEYHENLAWKVADDLKEKARRAAERYCETAKQGAADLEGGSGSSTIYVMVHTPDADGRYRCKTFKKVDRSSVPAGSEYDLYYLLNRFERAELQKAAVDGAGGNLMVSVRIGKRGQQTYVDLPPAGQVATVAS